MKGSLSVSSRALLHAKELAGVCALDLVGE